jgi:hypothetical protein
MVSLGHAQRKMQALGGRPHWSKMHDLDYAEICKLYDLNRFKTLCAQYDPDNVFGRAPYLRKVLGTDGPPVMPPPATPKTNGVA